MSRGTWTKLRNETSPSEGLSHLLFMRSLHFKNPRCDLSMVLPRRTNKFCHCLLLEATVCTVASIYVELFWGKNNWEHYKTVSVHLLKKWRHFVSPKILLCFRVTVKFRFGVGRLGLTETRFRSKVFSSKCSRSLQNWLPGLCIKPDTLYSIKVGFS